MPIKRRRRVKVPQKPKVKRKRVNPFQSIARRVNSEDIGEREAAIAELQTMTEWDGIEHFGDTLLSRCDGKVTTLQLNAGRRSFQVSLQYRDRTKKPRHGHAFPTYYAVKTAVTSEQAICSAYIELCRQAERLL